MTEPGSLESNALKRKARLAELKAARESKKSKGEDSEAPALTLRNYKPADEALKDVAKESQERGHFSWSYND